MDVSRRRPRAYVIGPFRTNSEFLRRQNIARAERAALDLATLGFYYRCPHLHSAHFDGLLKDDYWLDLGLDLLAECDCAYLVPDESEALRSCEFGGSLVPRAYLLPGCYHSAGSAAEVEWCRERGVPVLASVQELRRFLDAWRKKSRAETEGER